MTRPGGGQWSHMWAVMSAALATVRTVVPPEVRAEEHLATDAIVAFVDGELGLAAHERAARHLAHCPSCTAEVAAQRQARSAVRAAGAPTIPQSLLAALQAIPHDAPLPSGPDQLAVTDDGQLVVVQRPANGRAPLGSGDPLGSGEPLGTAALGRTTATTSTAGATSAASTTSTAGPTGTASSASPDGARRRTRRARQGAGVVVSGLVLGALVLAAPAEPAGSETVPGSPRPGSVGGDAPAAPELARIDLQRRVSAATDQARAMGAR